MTKFVRTATKAFQEKIVAVQDVVRCQMELEVISDREIKDRRVMICENSSSTMSWYAVYVSVSEDEPVYELCQSGDKRYVEPQPHGGITHWGELPVESIDHDRDFWIGWDYAHGFDVDVDLEEVREDAENYAIVLDTVTLKKAARKKMSYESDWFKEGLSELYYGDDSDE